MSDKAMIHPEATVTSDNIGSGTRIWQFANVMKGSIIGKNCNICGCTFIEEGAVIGDDVVIKNGVSVWDGVTIEDGAFVGPSVVFTNDTEPRSTFPKDLAKTKICRGASLGGGCVIVAPVTIGEYATVGAGSVVTRDVKSHQLVCGNPAKPSGFMCVCGRKIADESRNPEAGECECGRKFKFTEEDAPTFS